MTAGECIEPTDEANPVGDRCDPLLTPLRIGTFTIRNRVIMGPMAVLAPMPDGRPSLQTIAFLEARARGGVGMIIVGGAVGTGRANAEAPFKPLMRMDVEDYVPDLRRVADAVHAHGSPIIAEVMTGFGRMAVPAPGRDIIAPSPINVVIPEDRFPRGIQVPGGRKTPMPRRATREEIQDLEVETIETCLRMQRAGWDGVEIPAHMSYFAASFLSPRTNWREDEYGGSIEKRSAIVLNIIRAVRAKAGKDFIVGLRILAAEHVPGGQGPHGYAAISKLAEEAGIDYLALTDGCYESMDISTPNEDGQLVAHGEAAIFKAALTVPILLQGYHDPDHARAAIEAGHGDAVMLARPLLADPRYVEKLQSGAANTIIRCDRGNQCIKRLAFNMPVRCSANPSMGREARSGQLPPVRRFLLAPVEKIILGLTGSPTFIALARRLMAIKARQDGSS